MKLSTRARYGLKALIDLGLHSANEDASVKLNTAEDMSLFQSLCSAYKACCPTSTVETAESNKPLTKNSICKD